MIAVGQAGAILRSDNGGDTWTRKEGGVGSEALWDVTCNPRDATWVAVGEKGALTCSKNDGDTWTPKDGRVGNATLAAVACDPESKTWVAVGKEGALTCSQDNGETWTPRDAHVGNVILGAVACDPESKTWVAVGEEGALTCSQDNGETWTPRDAHVGNAILRAVACDPESKTWVAVGEKGALIRSQDGGNTWQDYGLVRDRDQEGVDLYSVACDPASRTWVVVGGGGALACSHDDGNTWTPTDVGVGGEPLFAISYDTQGKAWVAVGSGGVISCSQDNGNTWTARERESDEEALYAVASSERGMTWVAVGEGGASSCSQDSGNTWTWKQRDVGSLRCLGCDMRGNTWVAAGAGGALSCSQDNGETWTRKQSDVGNLLLLNAVACDSQSATWVVVGDYRTITCSQDGGNTWTLKHGGARDLFPLHAVACDSQGKTWVTVGKGGAVVCSQDSADTWTATDVGDMDLNAVAGDSRDKTWVAVGQGGTIMGSRDSGNTWTATDVGDMDLSAVACDSESSTWVAVGSDGTLAYSLDAGGTWSNLCGWGYPLNAVACNPLSGTWVAVGESQIIRSSAEGKECPTVRSYSLVENPAGTVTLAVEVHDPNHLCSAVELEGQDEQHVRNTSWPSLPPVEREQDDSKSDTTCWKSTFAPKELLGVAKGENICFRVTLSGEGFRVQYPVLDPAFKIKYQPNPVPYYVALALGSAALVILVIYWLCPLWLLSVSRWICPFTLLLDKSASLKLAGPWADALLILPPLFARLATRGRVLDAWLARYGKTLGDEFERCAEKSMKREAQDAESRLPFTYCALPIRVGDGKEPISQPSWEHVHPLLEGRRALLQLTGAGGAGKSTLARQIGRWGQKKGQLSSHVLQPIWIDEEVTDPATLLVERVRSYCEDEGLPESFIKGLYRQKRLLVVVDRLSEHKLGTQSAWTEKLPGFLRAAVLTARSPIHSPLACFVVIRFEPLDPTSQEILIGHLVSQRDKGKGFDGGVERGELTKRLAKAVTVEGQVQPVTPLLVTLFVEAMLRKVEDPSKEGAWESLPASIPEVYVGYVKETCRRRREDGRPDDLLFVAAQAVACAEMEGSYQPINVKREDALDTMVAGGVCDKASGENLVELLIDSGVLTKVPNPIGRDQIRFALDPVAEYVAAGKLADDCGSHQEKWQELVAKVLEHGESAKGFLEALRITHATYSQDENWPAIDFAPPRAEAEAPGQDGARDVRPPGRSV